MLGSAFDASNQDVQPKSEARDGGAQSQLLRNLVKRAVRGEVNHYPTPDRQREETKEREGKSHASKS